LGKIKIMFEEILQEKKSRHHCLLVLLKIGDFLVSEKLCLHE
jgi:hypothetical protein